MTLYEFALLRGARQLWNDDQVAHAAALADRAEGGDAEAEAALWRSVDATLAHARRRRKEK